jgi:DNA-directed RNA polymerase subunit RPC12/RpoP
MKIVAGLKAAARALVSGPPAESFRIAGKQVQCPHCGNILFRRRKASLNTAASSVTSTEWADREACILVCANCSRIEWFYDDVKSEKISRQNR